MRIRFGRKIGLAVSAGSSAGWTGKLALAVALAFPLTGMGADAVATMGAIKLGADDVKRIVENRPQLRSQVAASADTLDRVVREALVRRALLDEARSRGWDKRPEVAQRADEAREQVILNSYMVNVAQPPANYPGEDEVKAYFETNRSRLTMPQRYHLAQIFVKRPLTQGAAADAAAKRAAELARRAKSRGTDFSALAKTETDDEQGKDKGGDIGWYVEGNVIPEIRAALPKLKAGDVSEAITSAYGWHIVKLIEAKPPSAATLEEARPSVVNALRSQKAVELERAHVEALLKRSPVVLDSAVLSKLRNELK